MLFDYKEYNSFVVLKRYGSDDREIVEIPPMINGKPVTRISDECFFGHHEIKTILFSPFIERIGNSSFEKCSGISELILPSSVTHIGINAFRECTGLKKVVLSPNLKVLNQGVFSYCGLTHVDFIVPFGLEEIRENAFFHSGSFELALPESVTKIGPGAFCFGPSVKTSLSRDGSWFSVWPYQETVRLKGGVYGKVVDYSLLSEKCGVLTVNVEEEIIHVFFPSVDGDYRFFKDQSQTRMEEYTIDGEVKSYYEAWIIGAFNYQSFYQADEFVKTENPRDRKMPSPDQPTDAEMIHKNNERISPDSDVVVSFANEAEVMLKLIAEREKEKERILSEAYDWALDQQRELQLVAQPLRLTFTNGDTIADEDGFTISVFYKKSTDEAILRRDWEDRMAISYNILTNFDEIAQIAPKSLNLMLKNGLKIKKRWEEGYGFFD